MKVPGECVNTPGVWPNLCERFDLSSVACVRCGVEFEFVSTQRKYCSAECRENRAKASKSSTQICTCVNCGKSWSRATVRGQRPKWCTDCKFISEKPCGRCGEIKPIGVSSINCTSCWDAICIEVKLRAESLTNCVQCGVKFQSAAKGRYCSRDCSYRAAMSPLSLALSLGDQQGVIDAIRADSILDDNGCWVWGKGMDRSGYPTAESRGKRLYVHRIALEAKLGKSLGSQQSHHVCANSLCVNPDHLQPATYAENIAEMKARHSYLDRIRELEAALAESVPDHPLLDVAGYALVD